jgi:LysR family transcriptional regulator, glycine cleavage system transcriptional activator
MSHASDLPPLTNLLAFHAAAKSLSFKQAASDLGVTPSAISHRIRALEQDLGQPLFHRHVRSLTLTASGVDYQKTIESLFANLEIATAKIRNTHVKRPLRVSVLPLFASAVLIPRLPEFRAKHPHLEIEIDTKSSVADLADGDVDIGIRNMQVAPTGPGVSKLLDTKTVLLCAPEIAKKIHSIKDLENHTLIHCAPRPNGWSDWLSLQGFAGLRGDSDLWVDTIPAGLEAANLGQGIVLTMAPIAQLTLAGSRLVEPIKTDGRGGTSYFLVHRPEDVSDQRITAFRDWLINEMKSIKQPVRPSEKSIKSSAVAAPAKKPTSAEQLSSY